MAPYTYLPYYKNVTKMLRKCQPTLMSHWYTHSCYFKIRTKQVIWRISKKQSYDDSRNMIKPIALCDCSVNLTRALLKFCTENSNINLLRFSIVIHCHCVIATSPRKLLIILQTDRQRAREYNVWGLNKFWSPSCFPSYNLAISISKIDCCKEIASHFHQLQHSHDVINS